MTYRLRWYGQNRNQMLNSNMADVWANSMACHPTATCHNAGCYHLANSMSWSHSYVSHRRVLPLANSTACHPRATCHISGCSHLAKSMSWSCHIAGCNNSIRHIENRFSPYFIFCFVFLNAVWALKSGGFRIVSDTLVLIYHYYFMYVCVLTFHVLISYF